MTFEPTKAQSTEFNFEPYFGISSINEIADEAYFKIPSTVNKLQIIMNLNALRSYIAHGLNNPEQKKHNDDDIESAFNAFICDALLNTKHSIPARQTPQPALRKPNEHSLTAEKFNAISSYLTNTNTVMTALPIIHSLLKNYLDDLYAYFEALPEDYSIIKDLLEIKSFIESTGPETFATELAPALIYGLPEGKKDGLNLSKEDWIVGIRNLFDRELNAFETTKAQCPFSKIIRQVFATNLGRDENGNIIVLPETQGGALPVFVADWNEQQKKPLEQDLSHLSNDPKPPAA